MTTLAGNRVGNRASKMLLGSGLWLGGFVVLAAVSSKALAKDIQEAGAHLPETHSWDTAFFMAAAFFQYSRLLYPVTMLGLILLTIYLIFLIIAFATGGVALARQGLLLPFTLIPMLFLDFLQWRTSFRAVNWHRMGYKYVGLSTLFYKRRGIMGWTANQQSMTAWQKFAIVAALVSWQEWLFFAVLGIWALLAFSPDLLVPGTGWPLRDAKDWVLMQLDLAWGTKWLTLCQAASCGLFTFLCLLIVADWWQRRLDLKATAAIRRFTRVLNTAPEMGVMFKHLLPSRSDKDKEAHKDKAVRMGSIINAAYCAPTLEERLLFPCPTLMELLVAMGFIYGIILGLLGARIFSPELHPLLFVLLLPAALPEGLRRMLEQGDAVAWIFTAVGLVLTWGVAKLITRAKRKEWMDTFALHQHFEHSSARSSRATAAAIAFAEARHGPYPTTIARIFDWAKLWSAVLFSGVCGCMIIGWVTRTHYLPAVGLPAYSSMNGEMFYCASKSCVNASTWVRLGGGWQVRGSVANANAAVGAKDGRWAGWWDELYVAARINLLAARAWRISGVAGVKLAMEAVMVASGPEGLSSPEVRKLAVAVLRSLEVAAAPRSPNRQSGESVLQSSGEGDLSAANIVSPHGPGAGGAGRSRSSVFPGPRSGAASRQGLKRAAPSSRDAGGSVSSSARVSGSKPAQGSAQPRGAGSRSFFSAARNAECDPSDAPPEDVWEYTECTYEAHGRYYRRFWVPGGHSWHEFDEYDEYDDGNLYYNGSTMQDGGYFEAGYEGTSGGSLDAYKWLKLESSPSRQPKATSIKDTKSKMKSKTSFPASGGVHNDISWGTVSMLALVAVAAAFLVVMQPEWVKSPGKHMDAALASLTSSRSKRAAPPQASAGRSNKPGGKKPTKQQQQSGGAAGKQQKPAPALHSAPAAAVPKTIPAAGASLVVQGQGSKVAKPEPAAATAAAPAPARGRGAAGAGAIAATSAAHKRQTATSKEPMEGMAAVADMGRKQMDQQDRGTDVATPASAPAPTAGAGLRKGEATGPAAANAATAATAGCGASATHMAAKEATAAPRPEVTPSHNGTAVAWPGMVGSGIAGSVTAAAAAALPLTSSLIRKRVAAEPAPSVAPTSVVDTSDEDATPSPAPGAATAPPIASAAPPPPGALVSTVGGAGAVHAVAASSGAGPAAPTATPRHTVMPLTSTCGAASPAAVQPTNSAPRRASAQSPASAVVRGKVTSSAPIDIAGAASTAASTRSALSVSNGGGVPVPVPVPVPVIAALVPVALEVQTASVSPRPPAQPSTPPATNVPAGGYLGLNPALARALASLGRLAPTAPLAPAGSPVAGAAKPAQSGQGDSQMGTMPTPRGGIWGNVPGMHPDLCGVCQAQSREVCVLHGHSVHLSLCSGCAATFALGSPCPLCGEAVVQKFQIDTAKLKRSGN